MRRCVIPCPGLICCIDSWKFGSSTGNVHSVDLLDITNFRESNADFKIFVQRFLDRYKCIAIPADLVPILGDST